VSYYTENTGYVDEVQRLIKSLILHGLPYSIESIKSRGNWNLNTRYKAEFILKMLDKYEMPLVFLDADAEVKRFPYLFQKLADRNSCDIAVLRNQNQGLLSGTMYINNTDKVREILGLWILENKNSHKDIFEQTCLQKVLLASEELKRGFVIENLPEDYVYIDNIFNCENPVIWHHQASRKYKKEMDFVG